MRAAPMPTRDRPVDASAGSESGRTGSGLLRASGLVALCTLASRVLGLVRDSLGAALFGAGWEYGVFNLAWLLPNLFRRLFGEGALASAFVPAFARALRESGDAGARRLVASVAGALIALLGLLCAAGAAAAVLLPPGAIAPLLGESRDASLLLRLSAILSPYLLLVCLYALATAILNSLGRFFLPAVAPALLNVVWIAGLGVLTLLRPATLEAAASLLAFFVLAGGVAQLALQLPALRAAGFLPRPRLDTAHAPFRGVVRDMGPIVLGLAVVQLNLVVDQAMAWAFVAPGANTYIYLGNRLMQFPLSLVGAAAATASFPALAHRAAEGDFVGFRRAHDRILGFVVFLAAPAGAGLLALAEPVVRLLFEHGRFGAEDSRAAAGAVRMYACGVPFFCAAQILTRAHYALGDVRTPVRAAVALVFANVLLNLALVRPMGVAGLALATTICSALNVAVLAVALRAREIIPPSTDLLGRLARSAIAAAGTGLVTWGCFRAAVAGGLALLPCVGAALLAGAGSHFVSALLLRSPELNEVREAVARRN